MAGDDRAELIVVAGGATTMAVDGVEQVLLLRELGRRRDVGRGVLHPPAPCSPGRRHWLRGWWSEFRDCPEPCDQAATHADSSRSGVESTNRRLDSCVVTTEIQATSAISPEK